MHLDGSCHCGAVTFSLESRSPVPFMHCHCSICRKTAGSGGFAINLGGDAATLKVRGRKHLASPRGAVYDLERIFEDLNRRFFHGLLGRPHLSWSRGHARNSLGHYDPAHNTIVVSRVFDHPRVPGFALEYLLYHEMLHLKHPVKLRGSRRCVHSAEFQAEEDLFPQVEAAKAFLKRL